MTSPTRRRSGPDFEADAEAILAVLKKNRRKLEVDPSRRKFQENFRREHAESMEVPAPPSRPDR